MRRPLERDALVILGWYLLAGLLGGLLWWQLTPLAEWTRTASNATMDEQALSRNGNVDGWFFVLAGVGGLVSGFVLTAWRRRDPVATVVLVAVGSVLACAVMYSVGHLLGPGDVNAALRRAQVGAHVPVRLELKADGLWFVWSITSLLTSVAVLWGTKDNHEPEAADPEVPHVESATTQ